MRQVPRIGVRDATGRRDWIASPPMKNVTDRTIITGTSSGLWKKPATSGHERETNRVSAMLAATFTQKSVSTCSRVIDSRWTVAVDRPASLKTCANPITSTTMATRPKSSGLSNLASTTVVKVWRANRALCAPSVATPPRTDLCMASSGSRLVSKIASRHNRTGSLLTRCPQHRY